MTQAAATIPAPGAKRYSRAYRGVPREYFEEAAEVGRAVFAARTVLEKDYAIGGLTLRIRYCGDLVQGALHPALAHVETPRGDTVDLTINVWDESHTEQLLPEPHPLMRASYRDNCLEICSNRRYLALDEEWQGTRSYIDRQAGEAWHCIREAAALPCHERAAPLRSTLNALLSTRDRHLVHASAVGTPRGGVLFVGPPRAGKSSTALSCLGGRLGYLADGWCGIHDGGEPRIFSVYACAKLRPDNLDRFTEMRDRVAARDGLDDEKAIVFLSAESRSHLLAACPAKAILIPQVTGGARTVISRGSQRESWVATVSWSLGQLPGCRPESSALLTRFCARLPAYHVKLGTDRREIASTLESFLAEL